MGTIRDYFESDSKEMNVKHSLSMYSPSGVEIGHTIDFKVHLLIDAHSKYISIFSGKEVDFRALLKHLENHDLRSCNISNLLGQSENFEFDISVNSGDTVSVKDLVFSNKLMVYVESKLSEEQKSILKSHGKNQGFSVEVRDINYAELRSKTERPLAFISHAKSDGREFSTELANELSRLGCPVWFDEFSLNVGDCLVESIDTGLKNTEKCIFVLSPDFLSNEGWCKYEFKTASMKQIFEKKNIMLLIWHGIQKEDVYEYSAALAGTVGVQSSLGVSQVAKKLSKVLLG